ncbi:unnamed protein product [Rotaria sp. Silwood2]|nr:unnamed protein product [Rotaria sp. Silwood2]CAF2544155.1 unnamed protein product [Rotaria sp. Silwood2]CAF2795628.1 unnamed protein product [Rotaria sp. Silwood2]CAF2924655.1 unnamed protein product [Rotaria sp. Silwood2]CAF3876817.1 unnamed protein product [Rotaria sp. Silwood2]
MQPTYLYTSDFDREVRWRSNFSTGIPVLLGVLQMLLTFAIIGLEIVSVVISPIVGTLYAGFWCSVIFMLSWVSMLGLVCCHRAHKWASYMCFISILCSAAAIALIVLDILFIRNIDKCFFLNVTCNELILSYSPLLFSQPLGRKVQILKAQLTCAVLMLVTAILYMYLFISTSMTVRRRSSRVLIEHHQLPVQFVRQTGRYSPALQPWKSTSVPVTDEPNRIECPHCGTLIKLTQKKRYVEIQN